MAAGVKHEKSQYFFDKKKFAFLENVTTFAVLNLKGGIKLCLLSILKTAKT